MAESLKQKTKHALYWRFLDLLTGQCLTFAIGIVMARLLSPTDYGVAAIPSIFLVVASIFSNAGFGQAMVRKPELTDADIATAFYYGTGMGLLIYTGFFFAAPLIADFYSTPVLTPLTRVAAIGFLTGPLGGAQGIILQRRMDFRTPTLVGFVIKIVCGVTGITMAYHGYGVWALAISGLLGSLMSLAAVWYIVRWVPRVPWSRESFRYLWGFGNKMILSQLLNCIYTNVVPGFIGKYFSPAALGIFNRAKGYADLPTQTLTQTVQSVTFPALSKVQDDPERLRAAYRRIIRSMAFVVFPAMLGLAALARPLIVAFITEKWLPCAVLLQILCFAMMWQPIHSVNLNLLTVKGRSDLFLRLELVKKGYGIVILFATLPLGLVAYCLGFLAGYLLELPVNTYYTGKLIGYGLRQQLRDLLPTLALSLAMFAAVWGLTLVIDGVWWQIAAGIPLGVAIYAGGAWLMRFEEIDYVLYMLRR